MTNSARQLRKPPRLLPLIAALALAAGPLAAQTVTPPPAGATQPNGGIGPSTPSKSDVKKDESAILPSADGHNKSAAPTMVRDCQKNPQDCTEGVTPADKTTAQGVQTK